MALFIFFPPSIAYILSFFDNLINFYNMHSTLAYLSVNLKTVPKWIISVKQIGKTSVESWAGNAILISVQNTYRYLLCSYDYAERDHAQRGADPLGSPLPYP
jgi:hypothetical protein